MDYAALAKVLHEIMPDSVSEVERHLTCFSCFRYLKNIIEKKGWKYPHAAYVNNLAALSRLYASHLSMIGALIAALIVFISYYPICRSRTFCVAMSIGRRQSVLPTRSNYIPNI